MEFVLTFKAQFNKRGKDKKSRSYYNYFLNNIQILKHKIPFEADYDEGYNHHTALKDVYLLNGKIYQTRIKFDKVREVSYPISKKTLSLLEVPTDLKINLIR